MKFKPSDEIIPHDKRAQINETILSIIDSGKIPEPLSLEDIYNGYTGIGGLHGLDRNDYDNYYEYSEDKKEIEQGQFFTPHRVVQDIAALLHVQDTDTICDPTCGAGAFFNPFKEGQCYGADIDVKAVKVASFLYPDAHIDVRDMVYYDPEMKFDFVVGNPPFNLRIEYKEAEESETGKHYKRTFSSQHYYCRKAAYLLKPGGILACVVPDSFLRDEFMSNNIIEDLNNNFSFIGQYKLADNAFKSLGVAKYETKVVLFQRSAESIVMKPYSSTYITYEEAGTCMKELQEAKRHLRVKLHRELMMLDSHNEDGQFAYRAKKYIYEIKQHAILRPHLATALQHIEKLKTQKKPKDMTDKEWDKAKLTPNKVLSYLRDIMNKQWEKPVNTYKLVQYKYGLKYKAYSNEALYRLKKHHTTLTYRYNELVTSDVYLGKLEGITPGILKLIERKRRFFRNQLQHFDEMGRKEAIDAYLNRFGFYNNNFEVCRFNAFQKKDLGVMLQKDYGILNWQQGCVDAETEYLTPKGWKKISDYTYGDKVAQFRIEEQQLQFVFPKRYIKEQCESMYHFKHKYGLDQMLSPEHRMLFKNKSGKKWGVKTAEEVIQQIANNKNGVHGIRLPTQFNYNGGSGIALTNAQLRVQIAVMADGHFPGVTNRCHIRIKKQRKIERLHYLLKDANLAYRMTYSEEYHIFTFYAPLRSKHYDERFYDASLLQLDLIVHECVKWDGTEADNAFFTTSKPCADFIQYCHACLGRTVSIYTDDRIDKTTTYTVAPRKVDSGLLSIKGNSISKVQSPDGYKYCFEVPSSYLILRRNNRIFITGNSGKSSAAAAWMAFKPQRNTFIIGPAVAINMTWTKFMTLHRKKYINIQSLKDVYRIEPGMFVLCSLEYLVKYERQLKKYIKRQSQKVNLVFDESDEITNAASKRTRAMLNCFRRVKRKILTTGTTTRNNINELYSQLELLYNNSAAMICHCNYYYIEENISTKDVLYKELAGIKIVEKTNEYYLEPFPPYYGATVFKRCFNPAKSTVFGIQKHNQDLYNQDELKDILAYTIITRKFREIAGDKYSIKTLTVNQNPSEEEVYRFIIEELNLLLPAWFNATGNARKDAMLRIVRQMQLLIKATSVPHLFSQYKGTEPPSKATAIFNYAEQHQEKIAIGCTTLDAVKWYTSQLTQRFPSRAIYTVMGDVSFPKRETIRKAFESTHNGILIATQQSLKSSVNIPSCNHVLMESLQWNIPKMEQFFFRFIRYDSKEHTTVTFINYNNTIETNLMALLMSKERLNDFIKTFEYRENSDIYDEYNIDLDILNSLITKEYDPEKKTFNISWGKAKAV